MEILLILIIIILIFGKGAVFDSVIGCFSLILGFIVLVIIIKLFSKFSGVFSHSYNKINNFLIDTIHINGISLLLIVFVVISLVIYIKSKRKKLNLNFLNAVSRNDTKTALRLINKTPNLNYRNFMSWTPLMIAAKRDNLELVNALIEAKVNLDITNKFGDTAYNISKFKGNTKITEALLNAGAKQTKPSYMILIDSIIDNDHEAVIRCLESGISPKAIAPSGSSALAIAESNKNRIIESYLREFGA